MSTAISQEQRLATLTRIRKVFCAPGDLYEIIFDDRQGHPVVPLTEWYRLRKGLGPQSTHNTYLTYLMPYLSLYVNIKSSPLDTGPEQGKPCLGELLNSPGKVYSLHKA
jgi:hypothetical protein